MKKVQVTKRFPLGLTWLVVLMFCLVSCETRTLVSDVRGTKEKAIDYVFHFEYNSHDYIMFKRGNGQSGTAGVVHDPDCKCGMDN